MKISACWITKNEEKNILRSIGSVKDVADELIVVDTGSTDGTVEAAKEAGARIEYFEWIGDFSAARNYAMSFASGDLIFFLDADEWFANPLTGHDRMEIEEIFESSPSVEALQIPIRNLNDQGALKTVSAGTRIMRNKADLCFHKKVHELLARKNGDPPVAVNADKWALNHTGYTESVFDDKLKRNIELLEDAAQNSPDPAERHLHHCYLVREYYNLESPEDGLRHLRYALAEPDMIRRQYQMYSHSFAPLVYSMLLMAAEVREKVSRREIYRKLVEPFSKYLSDYPGAPTIGLFYDVLFNLRDSELLSRIGPAMEAAKKLPTAQITYYLEAEMVIYLRAAEASLRSGRLTDVINYAAESFRNTQNKNESALQVMLSCMRGLPAQEIIAFLNSQFDVNNPQKLKYLSEGTRMHGFRDVHAYYLDKGIKAGIATKGDYLYLPILYGKYEHAVDAALGLSGDDAVVAAECLFLAAVCSKDERIYRDNTELLGAYANVLDAYFSGVPFKTPTQADVNILMRYYNLVALAGGLGSANELRRLFESQPLPGFRLMMRYCVKNGLYEAALNEVPPVTDDYVSDMCLLECLVMTGRCDEACEKIENFLTRGMISNELLNFLAAIKSRSPHTAGIRAGTLYDRYLASYDSLTDLTDIVNTGYFTDDFEKKKARTYKSLTPAQFRKQFAEDAAKPHINSLAEISERAGKVYADASSYASAMECYRFAAAQEHHSAANQERIADMFAAMGNYRLAGELRKNQ